MKNILLSDVTLLGIDCVNLERLFFAFDVCQKHIEFEVVKLLTHLPSENKIVVKIDPIKSIEQYSQFVVKQLYKFVNTTHVLIIQHDGFILNPFSWTYDFLKYDYIGAPWWYKDNYNVGNGGFSLRSRKLMEAVALDNNIVECHPEDYIICRTHGERLVRKGFSFAPEALAHQFAREGLSIPWNNEFGFHQADISKWQIHDYTDCKLHSKCIDRFYFFFPHAKTKVSANR